MDEGKNYQQNFDQQFSMALLNPYLENLCPFNELSKILKEKNYKMSKKRKKKFGYKNSQIYQKLIKVSQEKKYEYLDSLESRSKSKCAFYIQNFGFNTRKKYIRKNSALKAINTIQYAMQKKDQPLLACQFFEIRKMQFFEKKCNSDALDSESNEVSENFSQIFQSNSQFIYLQSQSVSQFPGYSLSSIQEQQSQTLKKSSQSQYKKRKLTKINYFKRYSLDKISLYTKKIPEIITAYIQYDGVNWVQSFAQIFPNSFWSILNAQTKSIKHLQKNGQQINPQSIFKTMIINSLIQLQNQLNERLKKQPDFMQYVLTNYLGTIEKPQFKDKYKNTNIQQWSMAYYLYQAGRYQECYDILINTLNEYNLCQELKAIDNSIYRFQPKTLNNTSYQQSEIKNIFHQQFLFALKDIHKCASNSFCNTDTLDVSWVILRYFAIFKTKSQLKKKCSNLYNFYRQKNILLTSQHIKNLLYMLGYGQIVDYGPNQLIAEEDYLHYLIAIKNTAILWNYIEQQYQDTIIQNLSRQLQKYIQFLILNKQLKNAYFYMLLFPPKQMKKISELIYDNMMASDVNWDFFKKNMLQINFQSLIRYYYLIKMEKTCQYYEPLCQFYELSQNPYKSMELILKIFENFLPTPAQLNSIWLFISNLWKNFNKTKSQYQLIMSFFLESVHLQVIQKQKNFSALENAVCHLSFIQVQLKTILNQLKQRNQIKCYIDYLRTVVKCLKYILSEDIRNKVIDCLEKSIINFCHVLQQYDEPELLELEEQGQILDQKIKKIKYEGQSSESAELQKSRN